MRYLLLGIAAILVALVPAAAADVIRFGPGPNGSTRITTPWGQFVAVQTGDEIWVGAEAEWNGVIADQVARDQGLKRVRMAGERPGERFYVDASAPSTRVGTTMLSAITTSIVFGVPASKAQRRPPRPAGAEYVNISWTPNNAAPTRAMLSVGGRAIAPNDCGSDQGFRYCEFTALHAQLLGPARIVFLNRGATPAVLAVPSLAKASFASLALNYRSPDSGPLGPDDQADLKRLHSLDPSIPLTIR